MRMDVSEWNVDHLEEGMVNSIVDLLFGSMVHKQCEYVRERQTETEDRETKTERQR